MGYDINDLQLTLNFEVFDDWSVKDIRDLERAPGVTVGEMPRLFEEGRVPTLVLRAWCWVENRRRWPTFTLDAVDEIPYGKFMNIVKASLDDVEAVIVAEETDDSPLDLPEATS